MAGVRKNECYTGHLENQRKKDQAMLQTTWLMEQSLDPIFWQMLSHFLRSYLETTIFNEFFKKKNWPELGEITVIY